MGPLCKTLHYLHYIPYRTIYVLCATSATSSLKIKGGPYENNIRKRFRAIEETILTNVTHSQCSQAYALLNVHKNGFIPTTEYMQ